jgi:hypothetical protein
MQRLSVYLSRLPIASSLEQGVEVDTVPGSRGGVRPGSMVSTLLIVGKAFSSSWMGEQW